MQESHEAVRRLFEKFFIFFIFNLVLALYPYTADPTGDVKDLLIAWGALVLGGGWLFAAWWNKVPLRAPRVFGFPLAGLLTLYFLASLWGKYHMLGLGETTHFLSLAMLYFVASQIYVTHDAVVRLLKTLVLASFVATLYGFLQAGGYDPVRWDPGDKATDIYLGLPASYGNPNFAAHVMVLTLPAALYLAIREKKWYWLIAAAALVLHLGMTGQRASYLAFAGAACLAVIVWQVTQRVRKPLGATAAALGAWFLLGVIGIAAGMSLLSWRTGSPLPLDTSLHIRYWSYVSATDMLRDAPILGHGPGAYAHTYHKYWTQLEKEWFVQENRKNRHVHNDLMEISIDAGLPAAGLYLLIFLLGIGNAIAWAVRAGPRERTLGVLYTALFAGFLIDGLFGFNLRVPVSATFFFLLLGGLEGLRSTEPEPLLERKWGGLKTIAVLALSFIALFQSCVFASELNLFKGMQALRGNGVYTAEKEFERGEALAPWNAQFALQRSKVAYLKQDIEGAIAEIDRAFTIDPDYFPARLTRARYLLLAAQRAVASAPQNNAEPLKLLQQATDDAKEVLNICGKNPDAEKLLGRAAAATAIAITTADPTGGAKEARPYWEQADKYLDMGLKTPSEEQDEIYLVQAQVKLALGKPLEAEAAYERAAKANPSNPVAWGQFLNFAHGNKRYERIRNTLVAAVGQLSEEEKPRKDVLSLVRMCLANVYENGYTDLDRAEAEYRAAIDASPQSPEAWTNFARFAFQHDRVDALKVAVKATRDALVNSGQEVPAQLSAVYAAIQRDFTALEKASAVLLAQVRSHPENARLDAKQCYEWSARLMLDVLQSVPAREQCVAKLNLAIIYLQLKLYPQADALFAASYGCLPDALAPRHAAMWSEALLEQDRGIEAVNLLQPFVEKNAGVLDVALAYARALTKIGRIPEAKAAYEKLLANPEVGTSGRELVEKELATLN